MWTIRVTFALTSLVSLQRGEVLFPRRRGHINGLRHEGLDKIITNGLVHVEMHAVQVEIDIP